MINRKETDRLLFAITAKTRKLTDYIRQISQYTDRLLTDEERRRVRDILTASDKLRREIGEDNVRLRDEIYGKPLL